MKLSCIISTRNQRHRLSRTLAYLKEHAGLPESEWELLVVDNASTDGTAEHLAANRWVRVISLPENEGAPARNLALAEARGKFVAFLGDDVRPVGRVFPQAIGYLSRHPRTVAVVGRVVRADGSAQAPALPAVLMGDASVVRRAVLDEVGGFASEFAHQAPEYELSFRIWRSGYRIERFEDLQFARDLGADAGHSELACKLDLRNNLIIAERYLPRPLRRAYRHDWMRRYAMLARREGSERAVNAAVKETRIWARREASVGRKMLGPEAVEAIFRFRMQRDTVAQWAVAHAVRRVCIADWGKNLYATFQACRHAGLEVAGILDNAPTYGGARYRQTAIVPDSAIEPASIQGIVISTLNPAQLDARSAELAGRFACPILKLWTPAVLAQPPHDAPAHPGPSAPRNRAA